MKALILLFSISLVCSTYAQRSIFVRVYDLSGKKIHKGRVVTVTDTFLQLEQHSDTINIPARSIGSIRTRHSIGNNILIGSIIGVSSVAILGAATAEPDKELFGYTAGEGALGGALLGLPVGALVGGITIPFKNSKYYLINGDATKWKAFQHTARGNRVW